PFRYPCIALDGTVTYVTTSGRCAPADAKGVTFATGEAQVVRFVDALGLDLAGTIFLPDSAVRYPALLHAYTARQRAYAAQKRTLDRTRASIVIEQRRLRRSHSRDKRAARRLHARTLRWQAAYKRWRTSFKCWQRTHRPPNKFPAIAMADGAQAARQTFYMY